ncbi:MAG: hypothetical protein US29_C0042G0008 [candidate division WS6 bacterium GW2011_GWF1_36_8]|uniref:Uncharacterized protein n=1 Tax=candidate division WS6 bacterium GW2011_GWF1_36_8 TaxID=1619098 RepID=A0A0G0FNY7_9BACT|nr:MAG: hypothetical protein US29_C0042G0008 [candidate division WS6 bacterium GW2011_GWF1_36_8]
MSLLEQERDIWEGTQYHNNQHMMRIILNTRVWEEAIQAYQEIQDNHLTTKITEIHKLELTLIMDQQKTHHI